MRILNSASEDRIRKEETGAQTGSGFDVTDITRDYEKYPTLSEILEGDYISGTPFANKLLERESPCDETANRLKLGLALYRQGRYREAEAQLRIVIELAPDDADAHNLLGSALLKQEKYSEAETHFRIAVGLSSNNALYQKNLGSTLHSQGRCSESVAAYIRAIELAPNDADAHNKLGTTLRAQGYYSEAEVQFRIALGLDPDNAVLYHTSLGITLNAQMRHKEAAAECMKAIRLEPNNRAACCELRKALHKQGRYSEAEVQVGGTVLFGTYEQDDNLSGNPKDIEWIVLDKKDGKALLISKYALDCQPYDTKRRRRTWETCFLRKWLNNDFVNTAFSGNERAAIRLSSVSADRNPNYSTDPGNATQDRVFLLSIPEAYKYFATDAKRVCKPTAYAKANDALTIGGTCWWWLRSPGYSQDNAAFVYNDGDVLEYGSYVDYDYDAVRPALWINLES